MYYMSVYTCAAPAKGSSAGAAGTGVGGAAAASVEEPAPRLSDHEAAALRAQILSEQLPLLRPSLPMPTPT